MISKAQDQFSLTSSAFKQGEPIPTKYTCSGENIMPGLRWDKAPKGTKSFAIIMDDPDAPRGTFTHWLAYDIPADTAALRPTEGKTLKNSFGRSGYGGPCPPPTHGVHRYNFTVYAVDVPALDVAGTARDDLEAALEGHALARAHFMGRYERRR